jgi:hypothetical protein
MDSASLLSGQPDVSQRFISYELTLDLFAVPSLSSLKTNFNRLVNFDFISFDDTTAKTFKLRVEV